MFYITKTLKLLKVLHSQLNNVVSQIKSNHFFRKTVKIGSIKMTIRNNCMPNKTRTQLIHWHSMQLRGDLYRTDLAQTYMYDVWPVSKRCQQQHHTQMSTLVPSYFCPSNSSGAAYGGLPQCVLSNEPALNMLLKPKSAIRYSDSLVKTDWLTADSWWHDTIIKNNNKLSYINGIVKPNYRHFLIVQSHSPGDDHISIDVVPGSLLIIFKKS